MRGIALCALAAIGINGVFAAGPADASTAAPRQSYWPAAAFRPYEPAIASVLPAQGEVVGVAHPVVVTFNAPVADRHAAERAIDIKSVPAMTGKFEWLDNDVVQWAPDRFWPAHTTDCAVGGRPVNKLRDRSRRRRRRQYLGSHVHRHHRRRRRGTAVCTAFTAPPTPLGRTRACSRLRWVDRSIRRLSACTPCCPKNVTW